MTIKRPSMRAAINGMCRSCIYDPYSGGGNWRQQVSACSSSNCPLHPLRPISQPKKDGDGAAPMSIGGRPLSRLHAPKNTLPDPSLGKLEGKAA